MPAIEDVALVAFALIAGSAFLFTDDAKHDFPAVGLAAVRLWIGSFGLLAVWGVGRVAIVLRARARADAARARRPGRPQPRSFDNGADWPPPPPGSAGYDYYGYDIHDEGQRSLGYNNGGPPPRRPKKPRSFWGSFLMSFDDAMAFFGRGNDEPHPVGPRAVMGRRGRGRPSADTRDQLGTSPS